MSKEMTPKESLQIIQDNLTPRTLAILTVEFNIVEQALDRLETLEKENQKWREIVGCDLCDALGREILLEENKKLKKENKELWENIEKYNHKFAEIERKKADLIQENEILKMSVKDTYDTGQEIICELTQENEKLKKENENLNAFVDAYANAREELLIRSQNLEKEKEQIKQWIVNKIKYLDNGVFLMSYERTKGAIEILNELLKEVFEL